MNHSEYLKRRDELLQIRNDSMDSFDKTILTLSTGALALSITFLEKIGNPFDKCTFNLIVSFWIGMLLVIILNLLSFYFASKNMDKKINELDNKYSDPEKKYSDETEKIFFYHKLTRFCNFTVLIIFSLSSLIFCIYIFKVQKNNFLIIQKNIKKEANKMTMDKTAGKVEVKQAQILTEGKIESPAAKIFQGDSVEAPAAVNIQDGKVEAPKAISQPTSTNQPQSNTSQNTSSNEKN